MNIDLLCKLLLISEFIAISVIVSLEWQLLRSHLRTSLAGATIIIVSTAFELFCLLHLGHFEDEVTWMFTLLSGIGFLIAADGK